MTEKELQKVYVAAKINYNPLDYTLSDRVLLESKKILPSIIRFNYESEEYLLATIGKHTGNTKDVCSYERDSIMSPFVKIDESISCLENYESTGNTEYSLIMNYRNNLNIDTRVLKDTLSHIEFDNEYSKLKREDKNYLEDILDNSNILEALMTLNVALRDKSSVLPVLKFAIYPEYLTYSYEEMLDAKYIIDYLENDTMLNIPIGYASLRDSIMCTSNLRTYTFVDLSQPDNKEYACQVSALNTVLYGIEILHAMTTIKDSKITSTLEYLLTSKWSPDSIANELYTVYKRKVIINKNLQSIIEESDNRKRFKAISLYLSDEENLARIMKIGTDMVLNPYVYGAPIFLANMVNFCNEYCLQYIRTKNILTLIDYIKNNGWKLNEFNLSETGGMSTLLEGLSSDTEDTDDYDYDDEPSKIDDGEDSMLDFHNHIHGLDGLPTIDNKFKKTPALNSLDEAISSFSDGIFSYDVRDVIDTSDKYKDRYNAIVENVQLLNKNLIKKIKEIKVYNEGGKNSGLSSGKLDIKNIHRYKTTDKIFCKNTYKIKESDLAFGIILDVSGSMHGDGIKNGVITMIILHETLKALNINHSIITHTEHRGYHTCDIKRYQNFKEQATYSVRKNYALAGITAESGNCDAAALKYMETAFKKVRNKDKICLIFSDGEPTECSDSELLKQIKHMESNGIKVIGIGVNFSNIKEYYKDNANGKNLKDMLDIVSNILKQYILDKKE